MGILTGKDEALKIISMFDLAFIGTLTDYSKGLHCVKVKNQEKIAF